MKIVIVGNGKIGSKLTSLLVKENHDVIVIDNKPEALAKTLNTQDAMCIEGNGATVDVLKEAGVGKAGMLIATTTNDELNMLCCLIAKKLGVKKLFQELEIQNISSRLTLSKKK